MRVKSLLIPIIISFAIILALIFVIRWLLLDYQPNNFVHNFVSNIVASGIGVILGGILAVFITLKIVNPVMHHQEEKRLSPLRQSLLEYWERYLIIYTLSLLQSTNYSPNIREDVSIAYSEILNNIQIPVDITKFSNLIKWLRELTTGEELTLLDYDVFQTALEEYKQWLEKMHGTLLALPNIFKDTPEVSYLIEMLLANFLGGLKMIEYKHSEEDDKEVTKLNFYSTVIIKHTTYQSFMLFNEIHNANRR